MFFSSKKSYIPFTHMHEQASSQFLSNLEIIFFFLKIKIPGCFSHLHEHFSTLHQSCTCHMVTTWWASYSWDQDQPAVIYRIRCKFDPFSQKQVWGSPKISSRSPDQLHLSPTQAAQPLRVWAWTDLLSLSMVDGSLRNPLG